MCSGSEAGSYLWLIDFVHHSILGLRVIKKKKKKKKKRVCFLEEGVVDLLYHSTLGFRVIKKKKEEEGCRPELRPLPAMINARGTTALSE